jgi:hypothetical protein
MDDLGRSRRKRGGSSAVAGIVEDRQKSQESWRIVRSRRNRGGSSEVAGIMEDHQKSQESWRISAGEWSPYKTPVKEIPVLELTISLVITQPWEL